MAKPLNVQRLGNGLLVTMDDGEKFTAVESVADLFLVSAVEPPPPPPTPPPTTSRFIWPFPLSQVTSEYGQRWGRLHAGIDFGSGSSNVAGTAIPASSAGTVRTAGVHSGYGNTVILEHGQGLLTLYAHMSRIDVSVGQSVVQGQTLGGIGNTGNSFGNHLHFETHEGGYRWDASTINPRVFIPKWNGA